MQKALFATAVALGVAIAGYAMMPPSALAVTPNTCAILAGTIIPNTSMQIEAADHLDQMIKSKIYAACLQTRSHLQTRSQQGASRMTGPGQAGTNTTNAGALVTFDAPGATFTSPTALNILATAVTGSYDDAGLDTHSFLRTSDGAITPFDPPGATCSPSNLIGCNFPVGITPDGTIVGSYAETVRYHGYLRAPNGTFTVFVPPGAPIYHS
jgi:hypothetical protein